MLKNLVNVAMVLSVCLSIGYAKPLAECKSNKDRLNGCIEKSYYESGNLEYEIPYENNERNGVWKGYYESGKLKYEFPFENDKANGVAKEYYESGKLKQETLYKNHRVITDKEYDEQGKLIKSQRNK